MRVLGDFENSIACLRGQMTQLPADNKHAYADLRVWHVS